MDLIDIICLLLSPNLKLCNKESKRLFILYSCYPELVSVSYLNQTLKTDFSKNLRQKFKVKLYSYGVNLILSEYNVTFNFCRVVYEKLVFQV